MPAPSDVAGVQQLLGMAQYLTEFVAHLSDVCKPLRDLTLNEAEWAWESPQQMAFDELKRCISSMPVLQCYNQCAEVTLQCDASQSGLGAALLQNGQSVAFATRALTSAETRYTQIEKELLAIVFACTHFVAYLFGRELVTIQTDHKSLEMIAASSFSTSSKDAACPAAIKCYLPER